MKANSKTLRRNLVQARRELQAGSIAKAAHLLAVAEMQIHLMPIAPQIDTLAALRDVVVWVETYQRGECRLAELNESIKDAKLVIKRADAKGTQP